jgi:hypothetical protein
MRLLRAFLQRDLVKYVPTINKSLFEKNKSLIEENLSLIEENLSLIEKESLIVENQRLNRLLGDLVDLDTNVHKLRL